MTTEYYQIPSQQGFLPLEPAMDAPDPWLAQATSSLSLNEWQGNKTKQPAQHPSLFEPEDEESSVSWNKVVPLQYTPKVEVKAPVVPKQFHSTSSKIDAWSVVDTDSSPISKPSRKSNKPQPNTNKQQPSTNQPVKQSKKPQVQQQQQQQPDEKPIEDELTSQNRYKTELCKSFTETGNCRYGVKCQFAHGKEEVRPILRHPKYKTEICKTFHTTGTCPYGIRCRFIHTRSKEEAAIVIAKAQEEEEEDIDDDEITGAAPPGIPVPQWSKSWNMPMGASPSIKNARHVVAVQSAF